MFKKNISIVKRWPISVFFAFFLALPLVGCKNVTPQKDSSLTQLQARLVKTNPDVNLAIIDTTKKTSKTDELLQTPLTLYSATQLMLLNTPQISLAIAQLDASDAAQWQASLLSPPHLSLSALKANSANAWQWDFGLSQSFVELFTRPAREKQAEKLGIETQLSLHVTLQSAITATEHAYFTAVAAKQALRQHKARLDTANAKALLAESLYTAGNFSELNYLNYVSQAQTQERELNQFVLEESNSLAKLKFVLGLKANQKIELPDELPTPLNDQFDIDQLCASQSRSDLQLVQRHIEYLHAQQNLIKKEYSLLDLHAGVTTQKELDGSHSTGPQIDMALPIFDQGQARLAQTNAEILGAQADLMGKQQQIVLDIQLALAQLEQAQVEYKNLQNARKTSAKRLVLAQREVNFMLASPFELIDLKAEELQLSVQQIQAQLKYWQARSQLELSIGHKLAQPDPEPAHEAPAQHQHKEHNHD